MTETFVDVLTDAASDDSLRAVHLRGAGSDFCAGSDWVAVNGSGEEAPGRAEKPRAGDLTRRVPLAANRLVELIHTIQLPVVCSVRGWAVGLGCNLALAADFTVAANDARFWAPFVDRGFTPDSGATWLLPRRVGDVRAREMIHLGRVVEGAEAAEWNMIHRAVPEDELDAAVAELVATLAKSATVGLGLAKWLLHVGATTPLDEHLRNEAFAMELSSRSDDFREGLKSFGEKRTPEFGGR
jgi:2-(1,2-epoxy-1,2-dihydrophenyl)acetyl-CoA isomerase